MLHHTTVDEMPLGIKQGKKQYNSQMGIFVLIGF